MTRKSDPFKRTNRWRANFRARSHDEAHATDRPQVRVPDHPMIPRTPGQLIQGNQELTELLAHLRSAGRFAYDSEFIGELTYLPKLCLIQVASTERVALIDPLADLDLTPFWELLADPSVQKFVHAGQQDLEPVIRRTGRPAANVLDTQIAGGMVGLGYPTSLSRLLEELLGVKLGKGLTFSHWDQRPLSAMQIRYAADDVRYLVAMGDALQQRLIPLGHEQWAAEECRSLCETATQRSAPAEQAMKIRGAGSLSPRGIAILRQVALWRDQAARDHDLPARAVLKDETMADIARLAPQSVDALARVHSMSRTVQETYGAQIIEAVQRGQQTDLAQVPEVRRLEESAAQRFAAEALWAAAQCLCYARQLDPALVTSRQEIGDLYRQLTASAPAQELRVLTGWRHAALGLPLAELFKGNARLQVAWKDGGLTGSMDGKP